MPVKEPVVLGGEPPAAAIKVPHGPIPEMVGAWVDGADHWGPGARKGGEAPRWGVEPDPDVIASQGFEAATFAAEWRHHHAPDQPGVRAIPLASGAVGLTAMVSAQAVIGPDVGLRPVTVGDEVILPDMTFSATAETLARRNLIPVIADVDPVTGTLRREDVEPLITDRTVAVMGVHVHHFMFAAGELAGWLRGLGIALWEDAAQAMFARFGNMAAGTIGDGGMVSNQGYKLLRLSEGCVMLTRHGALGRAVTELANNGRRVDGQPAWFGSNWRLAAGLAALGRAQLTNADELQRRRLAGFAALTEAARGLDGITPPPAQPGVTVPVTYRWPFRVDRAEFAGMTLDQLATAFTGELGYGIERTYPGLTQDPMYCPLSDPLLRLSDEHARRLDVSRFEAPNSRRVRDEWLLLPWQATCDEAIVQKLTDAHRSIRAHARRVREAIPA